MCCTCTCMLHLHPSMVPVTSFSVVAFVYIVYSLGPRLDLCTCERRGAWSVVLYMYWYQGWPTRGETCTWVRQLSGFFS